MWGIPENWGFIRDMRECVGKTIQDVELADLGFGYTVNHAWAVRFTDGTRAFLIERPSKGTAISPREEWMAKSKIFKPEELGELVSNRMRRTQEEASHKEASEKKQLAELQKKYG